MGQKQTRQGDIKAELKAVRSRLTTSCGDVQVSGRYHLLPKRLKDDYDVSEKELGSGYNGSVLLATSRTSGEKVAVKPFKLFGLKPHQRRELRTEAEIFLSMDHPHVARLKDVYQDETELHLVMECLEGGELFERISQYRTFSEKDAAETAFQMLLAINYLHTSKGIIHRDIKPENFLYDVKGGKHLKLIDFGFSKAHKPENKRLHMVCGTTAYIAPEVYGESYDFKCDLWSIGVVMYIILLGSMPFKEANEQVLKRKICAGEYDLPPPREDETSRGLSPQAHDFLRKLLEVDPEKRLSAEEALQHPFLELRRGDDKGEQSLVLDTDTMDSLCKYASSSRFKRHCLSLCAWSMTNAERSKIRSIFLELDKDHTGTVTLEELQGAIRKSSVHQAEQIFASFDVDANELIDYTDFLAAMLSSRIGAHEDMIRSAFARMDVDANGELTAKDMRVVLGNSFKHDEINGIVKAIDADGNGKISYDEFMNYLVSEDAEEQHVDAAGAVIDGELCKDAKATEGPTTIQPPMSERQTGSSKEAATKKSGICTIQ